jgi:type I restriction enzyme S subunit
VNKWKMAKLGNVCATTQGVQIPLSEQIELPEAGYIRYLYISDFKGSNKMLYVQDVYKNKIVTCDDLIMANTGSPGIVFKGTDGVLSNNLFKISFDKTIIDRDFLYRYLMSNMFQSRLQQKMKGGIQRHLGHKTIAEENIPLPPLEIQKQIAITLDTASGLLAMRKQQLAELDGLIKSVFYDMFGGPVRNEKGWEIRTINDAAPIQQSNSKSLQKVVWLLNLDAIESNSGNITEYKYIPLESVGNSTISFDENNVLYSKLRPYLNKVVMPSRFGFATSELLPLKPQKSLLNREYLTYLLRSNEFVEFITEKVAGAKMPRVVVGELKNNLIPLPPLFLQNKFASIVTKIDEQKVLVKKAVNETQILFDSLMSQYFE